MKDLEEKITQPHSLSCNSNSFQQQTGKKWYFVTKIVLTYCEKKLASDRENLLKFQAEGREFAKILRSLEQFIQAVRTSFGNRMLL